MRWDGPEKAWWFLRWALSVFVLLEILKLAEKF